MYEQLFNQYFLEYPQEEPKIEECVPEIEDGCCQIGGQILQRNYFYFQDYEKPAKPLPEKSALRPIPYDKFKPATRDLAIKMSKMLVNKKRKYQKQILIACIKIAAVIKKD